MAASDVEVRAIRADERADWEPLWKGYQAFYKVEIPDETTTVTWARLHDPAEPMAVLGASFSGSSARPADAPGATGSTSETRRARSRSHSATKMYPSCWRAFSPVAGSWWTRSQASSIRRCAR